MTMFFEFVLRFHELKTLQKRFIFSNFYTYKKNFIRHEKRSQIETLNLYQLFSKFFSKLKNTANLQILKTISIRTITLSILD